MEDGKGLMSAAEIVAAAGGPDEFLALGHARAKLEAEREIVAERAKLRDRFAIAALTGMLASDNFDKVGTIAADAYHIADLMLIAREP